MLVDLYTGAHVTVAMQEEGEGAGKMLTVGGKAGKKMEVIYMSDVREIHMKSVGELLWTKGSRSGSAVRIYIRVKERQKSRDYKSPSLSKASYILSSDDRLSRIKASDAWRRGIQSSDCIHQYSDLLETEKCLHVCLTIHQESS